MHVKTNVTFQFYTVYFYLRLHLQLSHLYDIISSIMKYIISIPFEVNKYGNIILTRKELDA